ncbi:MAG: hydrogenase maturation nickel metallochaperone HypA [Thermoleophilaceae bacterium]|nr:hydrogenase maturation nickel metallochaperone HypA [Thermoleophilaceae bacterium]
MHELSLSSAIVDTVERHADGRRVTTVTMTIGSLRQVVAESLSFYFEIVSRGRVCEGATLEQNYVEARVRCVPCDRGWTLDQPIFRCPDCGGSEIEVLSGEEFEVDSIDVTEEEAACIAPR